MNADEKRKIFEELLDGYQDFIESEFSYEDGKREAERKAWLNKYDGIKEPLIKDEKIRKAVRAWAEACGAKQIKYSIAPNQYYDADMGTGFSIKFLTKPVEVYLEDGKIYTIAELCGEEEE